MVIKASNFALSDAFKASMPKLCAGRPSYRQSEVHGSDDANAVKDGLHVAFTIAQIPRRSVPPGVDPQGRRPAQCRFLGNQSANSRNRERTWRADLRAYAAAFAIDGDGRSFDRPCARHVEGPSAGRSADRSPKRPGPR